MNDAIRTALATDQTIDITTIGRRSGQPRRIETWFYRAGGKLYLTGSPGKRDWYANLEANSAFTFHLKQSVIADLSATAAPVTDESERRRILTAILTDQRQLGDLDAWMAGSPLAEIHLDERAESS